MDMVLGLAIGDDGSIYCGGFSGGGHMQPPDKIFEDLRVSRRGLPSPEMGHLALFEKTGFHSGFYSGLQTSTAHG